MLPYLLWHLCLSTLCCQHCYNRLITHSFCLPLLVLISRRALPLGLGCVRDENLGREIAANTAATSTTIKFLRNREHRESSKSKGTFITIVASFQTEPTFAIPGRILAEKTTWHIYKRSCKAECRHPNHKNSVCKNCLEFGYPTNICMTSNKVHKCGYCGGTHNHFKHRCMAPGCNEKTPYRHTLLNCNLGRTTGDHYSLDRNFPTCKARNVPRASQSSLPQNAQSMKE